MLTQTKLATPCALCAGPVSASVPANRLHGLCPHCWATRPPADEHFSPSSALGLDGCISVWPYSPPYDKLIIHYKFGGQIGLARTLGEALAHCAATALHLLDITDPPIIIPVPLHPTRFATRGFDQSTRIAEHFASSSQLPFRPQALRRVRNTSTQSLLKAGDRAANVLGAFQVQAQFSSSLLGKSVCLVDDVLTTGATIQAAGVALREAGARSVIGCVVARAINTGQKRYT
jgi:ComF family protein